MSSRDGSNHEFFSKIETLSPVNEPIVNATGGVLYLYEADSLEKAQGRSNPLIYV